MAILLPWLLVPSWGLTIDCFLMLQSSNDAEERSALEMQSILAVFQQNDTQGWDTCVCLDNAHCGVKSISIGYN